MLAQPAAGPQAVPPANLFVDDDNAGAQDGSSLHPFRTVQQAIDAAQNQAVIAVAAGTYPQNIRVQEKTVRLYGGYAGGTQASYAGGTAGNFTARNPAANPSHLQGNGQDSVVTLFDSGASVVDGFLVTGGGRSALAAPSWLGGGFYVSQGSPTISNNVIEKNQTCPPVKQDEEKLGGGIYSTGASISILNNVIRNNTSGRGAGIAADGPQLLIRGNIVQNNVGVSDHGGGIYLFSPNAEISIQLDRGQRNRPSHGLWLGRRDHRRQQGWKLLALPKYLHRQLRSLGRQRRLRRRRRRRRPRSRSHLRQCVQPGRKWSGASGLRRRQRRRHELHPRREPHHDRRPHVPADRQRWRHHRHWVLQGHREEQHFVEQRWGRHRRRCDEQRHCHLHPFPRRRSTESATSPRIRCSPILRATTTACARPPAAGIRQPTATRAAGSSTPNTAPPSTPPNPPRHSNSSRPRTAVAPISAPTATKNKPASPRRDGVKSIAAASADSATATGNAVALLRDASADEAHLRYGSSDWVRHSTSSSSDWTSAGSSSGSPD